MPITLVPGAPEHRAHVPELVWSTGPSSYAYIFGNRPTFTRFIEQSWITADTYFAHTEATVALDGGSVVGIEIGYDGARNYRTKANLGAVSAALVGDGTFPTDALVAMLDRAEKASFLNPYVPDSAYYVLALAVTPDVRGTGVGAALLAHAAERGRRAGCRQLQLDVLSDNPAVGFYRARGLAVMAETVAPEPSRHGVPMELRMATALERGAA
jgi:ribosomal protein S18 acetylase RimI-like enzyme